jgi:hypothetical protein
MSFFGTMDVAATPHVFVAENRRGCTAVKIASLSHFFVGAVY